LLQASLAISGTNLIWSSFSLKLAISRNTAVQLRKTLSWTSLTSAPTEAAVCGSFSSST
jgi:hypothetical protein